MLNYQLLVRSAKAMRYSDVKKYSRAPMWVWSNICFDHLLGAFAVPTFTRVTLFTDTDGKAQFKEDTLALSEGTPQSMLTQVFASGGYQLRHSPIGFRSNFHCTGTPQWVFILGGQMEIGLQGGVSRVFKPGEHFYSNDTLPAGATFDPAVHGHWSRQLGPDPLITLFVRS
jgi:hypothetical protein